MSAAHTAGPWIAASAPSTEAHLRLADLAGEEVRAVEARACGTLIRFGSGAAIVLARGTTYDAAGLPVIEP